MADKQVSLDLSLDERVVMMSETGEGVNALIEEFKPFIISCIYRSGGIDQVIERDELISTAYIAFYEALGTYDIAKGHFLPFAATVIRRRLVDLARKESRFEPHTLPLDASDEFGNVENPAVMQSAVKVFNVNVQQEMLRYEIDMFRQDLADWGIDLDDLLRESPKHKSLVRVYREIVEVVLSNSDMLDTVLTKKYFPVKKISEFMKISQKKIERARKYIVASVLIAVGDYDYLSDYIRVRKADL